MRSQVRPAIAMLMVMTVLTGVGYPLAVTATARILFPWEAAGSLIVRDGRVIGAALIGQACTGPRYFHPRPSAAGKGYDAAASGGSNLGPTNRSLVDRVKKAVDEWRRQEGSQHVPVDLVTTSASGLDPHISPAGAEYQVARVARARAMSADQVRSLVRQHIEGRQLGILGEPRVNVLKLNMALDAAQLAATRPAR